MISERFTADILADIKDFQRKLKEVDKSIRKAALGVTIPIKINTTDFDRGAAEVNARITQLSGDVDINVNGDITDLQRAVTEARAALLALQGDTTITINGNSSGFNAAANNVERQTNNLSRKITEARIGADIGSFEKKMIEVTRALTEAGDTVTPEIRADTAQFQREILMVQERMREISRSTADPQVEADIAGFMAQMGAVQAQLSALNDRHDVDITADATGFFATAARVNRQVREFARERVVVNIISRWNNYQATMGQIASFSRNIGEVASITGRGGMILISPAAVPVIASAVGLIGNLGPMIGTLAGSTFALASAFGTAGIGVAAFAGIAVSNLNDVFGAAEDLKKLEEKLAKAEGWEERNKIMKEMKQVQSSLNEEQTKGLEALNGLKSTWSELTNALQPQTIQIFTKALGTLSGVLVTLKPMFTNVMDTANGLMDSLSRSIDSAPMKAFFGYLNTTAAPMLETITKAAGNFIQGFLSMMTAFGPLATETSNGFLKMSEGFATWAAKLGESTKFQSFVSYVSENMPKIRSIFGDAMMGIINTFAAFAPSSATMMSGLQDMMARFREWSSTLGENEGFKKFVNYFMTNGPVVVSVIGQIVTFITNLGIALAPLGANILSMVQSFLTWSNSMMQAHPWLGKIAAGALLIVGVLTAVLPLVLLANSLFSGLGLVVAKAAVGIAISAAKMAASWIVAMGPIGWVSAAVIGLVALIVANWDTVKAWTIKAWSAVSTAVSEAVTKVVSYVQTNFPRVYELIRSAMESSRKIVGEILGYMKTTFSNVLSFLKALVKGDFEGMRNAISQQMESAKTTIVNIWNIVKAHFSKVLSFLASTVGVKFAEIVSSVKSKMSTAKTTIQSKWEEAKSATISKIAAMVSSVASKFAEIVSKVKSKMGEAKNALSSKWEEAKSATSSKLAQLVTAAGTFFARVVTTVRTKMTEAVSTLGQKVAEMPGKVLSFVGKMVSAGGDLVRGLINGIKAMGSAAVESITGVVTGVIDKAKSLLKIKSPSRVFSEIGAFVGQGLAIGISSTQKANEKVMTGLTSVIANVAKNHAKQIKAIQSAASKEATAENKRHNSAIASLEQKVEDDVYRIKANAKAKKRNLTAAEYLRIEKIRKDSAAKIEKEEKSHESKVAAIKKKSATEIKTQEAKLQKDRLDAIKTFVDNKQKLEGLSAVQEAKIWEKAVASFKNGTQEKIEAQIEYQAKLKEINDKITSVNEQFLSRSKSINDELMAEEKRLTEAYENSVNERSKALYSFTGLFEEMKSSFEGTGDSLLANLKGQVSGFKDWAKNINDLASKGIEEGLLEELRAMGPSAYGEIAALNAMSAEQLTEYQGLWKEKTALARSQALEELEGMRDDTQTQIELLRTETAKQLDALKIEWVAAMQEATTGMESKLKSLKQVGSNAITGLMNGMESMRGPLMAKAQGIADAIRKTIQSALDIHSPSRVLATLGEYAGLGLIRGMDSSIAGIVSASNRMAQAMMPDVADIRASGVDIRSDIDNMKRQIKNELEVSMSVSHTGTTQGTSGGITQHIAIHSTTPLSPSEIRKEQMKASRQLAMEWGV